MDIMQAQSASLGACHGTLQGLGVGIGGHAWQQLSPPGELGNECEEDLLLKLPLKSSSLSESLTFPEAQAVFFFFLKESDYPKQFTH